MKAGGARRARTYPHFLLARLWVTWAQADQVLEPQAFFAADARLGRREPAAQIEVVSAVSQSGLSASSADSS